MDCDNDSNREKQYVEYSTVSYSDVKLTLMANLEKSLCEMAAIERGVTVLEMFRIEYENTVHPLVS